MKAAAVTFVGGLLLLSGCGDTPARSSAEASAHSSEEPVTATEGPTDEPLRLLILGDSIAIPEIGCGSCEGFDQHYAAYLERVTGREVELSNQARPNAAILDLQSVLDSDATVQGLVAKADVVVVSIGYNSGPPFAPDEPCHAPEAAHDIDQLNAILAFTPECVHDTLAIRREQLDAVYARVEALAGGRSQVRVTLGIFNNLEGNPGGDGTFADMSPENLGAVATILVSITDDWNAIDCAAATKHGFACADLYHAFNGPDGTESLEPFVAADFTHPSSAGQAVMARLLEKVPLDPVR